MSLTLRRWTWAALLTLGCALTPSSAFAAAPPAPAPAPSSPDAVQGYEPMPLPGENGNGTEATFAALLAVAAVGGAAAWALRTRSRDEPAAQDPPAASS